MVCKLTGLVSIVPCSAVCGRDLTAAASSCNNFLMAFSVHVQGCEAH
jgi:hypothetical protein